MQETLDKLTTKPALINFWRNTNRPSIYEAKPSVFIVNEYYVPFATPIYYYPSKEEELKDKDNKQKDYKVGTYEDYLTISDSKKDFYADYDESYVANFTNWLKANNKILLLKSLKQLRDEEKKQAK